MAEVSADTRAERLFTAADDAARLVRRVYITFLLLCVTVAAIIWSTTDEQLVRGSPLTLPQVNIAPRIDAVYGVVPWVILVFHFNLLLLLRILAQKLRRLEEAYSHLPFTVRERQDFRVRHYPFPFSHMILGVMRPLVKLVMWVTVIVLPLAVLLWAQIRFLPFHDEMITWSQRVVVVLDVVLLGSFWLVLIGPDGRALGLVCLIFIGGIGILLSGLVAVLPREGMEQWAARTAPESWKEKEIKGCREEVLMVTCWLFDRPRAPFHRNLRLEGKTLVAGEPSAEVLVKLRSEKEEVRLEASQKVLGFNLANRDLRFADFSNAILVKANLQGANLDGANFTQADLSGADLSPLHITEGGQCVGGEEQAQKITEDDQMDAGIRPIRKPEGIFCLTNLRNVKLGETKLAMARLPMARLHGANLEDAGLQSADLRGARLQGAVLTRVHLLGANLSLAQLQGAALIDAELQGANLSRAQLQGANLRGADLRGADLFEADLRGADLSNADLRGADLRGAKVGSAEFDSVDLSYSDLREVDRKPLTEKDYEGLKKALEKLVDDEERLNIVLGTLEGAIDRFDNIEDAKAAKNVLCEFGTSSPAYPCPSTLSVEQYYDQDLVYEVLGPLGCGDADIARGLARQAVTSAPSKRKLGPLLAMALLDPKCEGGRKLPEETKAELRRIASRR